MKCKNKLIFYLSLFIRVIKNEWEPLKMTGCFNGYDKILLMQSRRWTRWPVAALSSASLWPAIFIIWNNTVNYKLPKRAATVGRWRPRSKSNFKHTHFFWYIGRIEFVVFGEKYISYRFFNIKRRRNLSSLHDFRIVVLNRGRAS
jgi:hypothetical protein